MGEEKETAVLESWVRAHPRAAGGWCWAQQRTSEEKAQEKMKRASEMHALTSD